MTSRQVEGIKPLHQGAPSNIYEGQLVLPASQPSEIALRTAVEVRYFAEASLKTMSGVPQMPREEITREEALKRPCYYVGRYVAGLLIEAEKFDSQGRSQFLITYTYKRTNPSDSSIR
jgi:hypothetical protein